MNGNEADPVRIGILGTGSIGRHAARLLLDHRNGFEIVGAVTAAQSDIGRPLHELAGASTECDVTASDSLDAMLAEGPQVVLDATRSFLVEVADDVLACVNAEANVISCCEELAYPFRRHPGLAAEIDAAAVSHGVSVLGSGVNPGIIFDSLLLLATGAAWDVTSIVGRRVVDVSGFSQDIHRRLGIGYALDEFEAGHAQGSIAGHVGFPESIEIVTEGMGVPLDGPVEEQFEPILADTPAPTRYGAIPEGHTEGFRQIAFGRVGGRELIRLELLLHLRPEEAGHELGDSIEIEGTHPVHLAVRPRPGRNPGDLRPPR